MKPSRPEVVSGERLSSGSSATIRAARRVALTSLPVAKPGWTSTPSMSMIASAPVKVSSWSSPRVEPSIVYAQLAPKASTSKSEAPMPISSSGVKAIRRFGRGSSGWAARWATAVMISATPALSSAPSRVSPLEVTMSSPALPSSAGIAAGSRTVPPFGRVMTPPS